MREIAKLPKNGLRCVSTFSGAGGSCLGFEMAGWHVPWASEFVPAAAETHRANFDGIVDTRDIREVHGSEILSAIGARQGEVDCLNGSPPCASFSVAGTGKDGWGKVRKYSDTKQRVDDLFYEFIRLIDELRPKSFIAENVPALAMGAAKGFFKEVLTKMRALGYDVKAAQVDFQWLGVPQSRRRLIFIGMRDDLGVEPVFPKPFPYRYTVRDALPRLGKESADSDSVGVKGLGALDDAYLFESEKDLWHKLRYGESSEVFISLVRAHPDRPSSTITASAGVAANVTHPFYPRRYTIAELKRLMSFPDDFELPPHGKTRRAVYARRCERLGRSVPPVGMKALAETIAQTLKEAR